MSRSNSFNYLFERSWPYMQVSGCPLSGTEIPAGADPCGTLFMRVGEQIEQYRTVTGDMGPDEIRDVKFGDGQVYIDIAGKTTDIDLKNDLRKLTFCSFCASCPDLGRCPGVHEPEAVQGTERTEKVIEALILSLSGAVLDVGCGHSRYAEILRPKLERGEVTYTGLDPFLERTEVLSGSGCSFIKAGIEDHMFPRASFDAVLVLRSHNHFRDRKKAYRNILRAMKPGGRLIVVDNLPYAVVRQHGFKELPAGLDVCQQHCQNDTSWQVRSLLEDMPLYLRAHLPVRSDGFNQWVLIYQKAPQAPLDVLMVAPPLYLHKDHVDQPFFSDYPVLEHATRLRDMGFYVEVADALALPDSERGELDDGHYRLGTGIERLLRCCKKYEALTIVVFGSPFNHSLKRHPYLGPLISGLRRTHPGARLVLADLYFSGMHYIDTPAPRLLKLYPEIDHVLKGAAENTLPELLRAVRSGRSVRRVISAVPARRKTVFPDWNMIDMAQYQRTLRSVFNDRSRAQMYPYAENTLPMMTTYGCRYRCVFCSKGGGDASSYGEYPLSEVMTYLAEAQEVFQVRRVVFLDALVNFDPDRFRALLMFMKKRGMSCEFPNGFRADRLQERHVKLLSSLSSVLSLSAESGSQKVIDSIICKAQPLTAVERAAGWGKRYRMPVLVHYMIGLPGETIDQVRRTIAHALSMEERFGVRAVLQYAVPLPGTRLYALCSKSGHTVAAVNDYAPFFSERPMPGVSPLPGTVLQDAMMLFHTLRSSRGQQKLIMNITYLCQNRCVFCAIAKREKSAVPYAVLERTMRRYRARGVRLLDIDGGEPTTHPDLFKVIAQAGKLGYERINVTSNGRALASREYAVRLLLSGLTDILVSVHGHTAELHELHTQRKGSFEETMQGVRNIVRLRPDRIVFGVNITITKANAPYLPDFFAAMYKEGVRKINIQYLTPFGMSDTKLVPDPRQVARSVQRVIERYRDLMAIQVVNLPFCYLPGYERFVAADLQKKDRTMMFVSREQVNLSQWLAKRRKRIPKCTRCVYALVCDGVYDFSEIGV